MPLNKKLRNQIKNHKSKNEQLNQKIMNTIRILVLCLLTTFGYAQKKLSKISQSIKVDKDVVVDLNTSYAEIEIDTWNRDIVEIEAYLESDKLSEAELETRMKEIIDQYSPILEGIETDDLKAKVKEKQKQLRLNGKTKSQSLRPLKKINEESRSESKSQQQKKLSSPQQKSDQDSTS